MHLLACCLQSGIGQLIIWDGLMSVSTAGQHWSTMMGSPPISLPGYSASRNNEGHHASAVPQLPAPYRSRGSPPKRENPSLAANSASPAKRRRRDSNRDLTDDMDLEERIATPYEHASNPETPSFMPSKPQESLLPVWASQVRGSEVAKLLSCSQ